METKSTFKVLIVEDCKEICEYYRTAFEVYPEIYTLLFAEGVEAGIALLTQNPDVDLIVVDGELSPVGNWGKDFVTRVRPGFKGPMVASSTSEDMNAEMMTLGCDHVARKKDQVPYLVRKLLKAAHKAA